MRLVISRIYVNKGNNLKVTIKSLRSGGDEYETLHGEVGYETENGGGVFTLSIKSFRERYTTLPTLTETQHTIEGLHKKVKNLEGTIETLKANLRICQPRECLRVYPKDNLERHLEIPIDVYNKIKNLTQSNVELKDKLDSIKNFFKQITN